MPRLREKDGRRQGFRVSGADLTQFLHRQKCGLFQYLDTDRRQTLNVALPVATTAFGGDFSICNAL